MKILSEVDNEEIACDVFFDLDSIEVEELWDRSGKSRHGYVDPVDEAYVMFEETIEPYLAEMKKYQKMGLQKQAKNLCIGIIEGIRQYDSESKSEFLDWAVDIPSEYLSEVVDKWKKGNPDVLDIKEIEELLNDE